MLVRPVDFGYTPPMHLVDPKWTGLAAGYQAILLFQARLTAEFGRAVRVGHEQQFRKELAEWQKKRRIFFALLVIAPLSITALCLTAIYFRDVACVIIYWAVLVVFILGTLAVAGWPYVHEMVSGKPVPPPGGELMVDLEARWWDSLQPREPQVKKVGEKGDVDFAGWLSESLPDTFSALIRPEDEVLILGPSGIWLFIVESWTGRVIKETGTWKQIWVVREKPWNKRLDEKTQEAGPDDRWLQQKNEIEKRLKDHFHEQAWLGGMTHGGVVFSHPKVNLDKERIRGNTAAYGRPKAWVERILGSPPMDGLTQEIQLEILDVLAAPVSGPTDSARDEAERLYRQAVEELRTRVAKMVN